MIIPRSAGNSGSLLIHRVLTTLWSPVQFDMVTHTYLNEGNAISLDTYPQRPRLIPGRVVEQGQPPKCTRDTENLHALVNELKFMMTCLGLAVIDEVSKCTRDTQRLLALVNELKSILNCLVLDNEGCVSGAATQTSLLCWELSWS